MMELNGFTPTQKKILVMLQARPHTKDDIRTALGDEFMEDNNIMVQITCIRKKLGILGQDIVCRRGEYSLVRYTKCASRE